VASTSLHIALLAYISSATAHYDFDFDLTLPAEVEFGLTGEMAMAAASEPPRATGVPDPRWARDAVEGGETQTPDAGIPEDTDATPDTGADTDAGAVPDADADTAPDTIIAPPTVTGPSRIPPGAQLALRVDLKRVRHSSLAPDVTRFLHGVPDWQLLLNGSGIDPVADLDRLLIATPNLDRSRLVLAGRHGHEEGFARQSVIRLARSRGKSVRWQRRYGVATAPWHNRDKTLRTIALLGPKHFSITRKRDLERVLAMVQARELRDAEKEGLVAARGPEALLSMGPEEVISLEVEGVHQFILGNIRHVPIRLRLAVRESAPDVVKVSVLATYPSNSLAQEASVYWKKVATFYSQQLIASLAGFGKTLRRMDFKPVDERIEVSFELNADQIRFILSYAEGRLRGSQTKKGP
jgi:hypothetical protein